MPGSSAELPVKAKQGYPQYNVHSVLDMFIHVCNLPFKCILMLFAVPKNLHHPLSSPYIFES